MLRGLIAATLACLAAISLRAQADDTHVIGRATVVDGDTLDIGDKRIRLFGIDAAEMGQRCSDANGRDWRCGRTGARRLEALLASGDVDCVPMESDAYGRLVSRCAVNGVDIGSLLVSEGLAWAFVRYSDAYVDAELEAKAKALGIWSGDAEPPWDYRAHRWETAREAAPRGCPIKGNISGADGEHIYHPPWSPWYDKTSIDESRGERWFCDEASAIAAGWREAGRK